jgi:hypothetical protein
VREAAQDVQGSSQDCRRGIVRIMEICTCISVHWQYWLVIVGGTKCVKTGHSSVGPCLDGAACMARCPSLFIFAWPPACVFLLICSPASEGKQGVSWLRFLFHYLALLFWSGGIILHGGGPEERVVYRIYDFTVRSVSLWCVM